MTVEIEIAPGSDAYEAQDDRWLAQVAGLYDDLRAEGIPLRDETKPAPGAKGGAEIATVIAALGSAGVFTAAITVIKSWLSRERTRHVTIRVKNPDGTFKEIDIDAFTDNATLERLTLQAMGPAAGA